LAPFEFFIETGREAEFAECGEFGAPVFFLGMNLGDEGIHSRPSSELNSFPARVSILPKALKPL
jgi:hypothetical protein